jgi:hypothetical protein
MRTLGIEVLLLPPSSWTWRAYDADTKRILRSESANTEEEALAKAAEAKRELESQVGID